MQWAKSKEIKGLYVGFDVPGGEQFPLGVQPYKNAENPPMCRWKNCRYLHFISYTEISLREVCLRQFNLLLRK